MSAIDSEEMPSVERWRVLTGEGQGGRIPWVLRVGVRPVVIIRNRTIQNLIRHLLPRTRVDNRGRSAVVQINQDD